MSLRVLIVTNLFADPFNASRATFNQQQFGRLAEQVDLTVMVPVSWLEVIRQPLAYRRLRRQTLERWPFADYVIYWYVPGVGRRFHAAFLFLSLLLQRLPTLLFRRWDCLFGSWGYPDAVAVAAVAKLTGVPMIAKVHGSDVNVFTREPARRAQICWALNHSRHVVAVSQALADRLAELGVDPARTTVLYNGVDPVRFHPVPRAQARRDLGFADDERVILGIHRRRARLRAPNFDLRQAGVLEAFHQHPVRVAAVHQLREQLVHRGLHLGVELAHLGQAVAVGHHHLEGAGLTVAVGVLARHVDVEALVRVLDHRHALAGRTQRADQPLGQARLARAGDAAEPDHLHRADLTAARGRGCTAECAPCPPA